MELRLELASQCPGAALRISVSFGQFQGKFKMI